MANNKINQGKKYIHKGVQRKMILEKDLEFYLKNGWELGMGKRK